MNHRRIVVPSSLVVIIFEINDPVNESVCLFLINVVRQLYVPEGCYVLLNLLLGFKSRNAVYAKEAFLNCIEDLANLSTVFCQISKFPCSN